MTATQAAPFIFLNSPQLLNINTTEYNKTRVWFKKKSFTDSHQTFFCNVGVSGIAIGHACPR